MAQDNNFKEIEIKWQKFWATAAAATAAKDDSAKPKKYILVEFPYPSGEGLHIGHTFSFTGGDIYARFKRMQGYNVLFPMGWDAFGLPTENFAIKKKRKPQEITKENTDRFRNQMKELAFSFDWKREVNTTDPLYYKWTQWIFIKLFEKGLAYKQEMPINWCPKCKIGLANEEVVNGKCERCGAEVSRRSIAQWVVKITDYADRLIEGLGRTNFIDKVKQAQINWIGKSEGARVKFEVKSSSSDGLEVFTTRADTLWGVTFMVISPEHKLVMSLLSGNKEVREYAERAKKKSDLERAELQKDKTGVDTGIKVINPVNGKEIPLWVADYVLMGYGTGVVMGVPAHDGRDWEFAKKYGLSILPVIDDGKKHDYERGAMMEVDDGVMINSDFINGLQVKEAIERMNKWIEEKGIGEKTSMYHLRDWIFSRQHYWGEPIPMVYCEKDGWVPVPEDELPVKLPEVEVYEPTDTGESPLAKMTEWVKTTCPKCGGGAKRETDTMPNWAGSDWYFLRYLDNKNARELASMEKQKYWMPVDIYIGGDEHNTLHLLYSRFIHKFLHDLGIVSTDEPYDKRMSHGVILGPDNQRMSKSRGNVVVPEDVTGRFGVDVTRCYLMFMGPFTGTMAWNEKTLMGVKRFLDRFEKFILGRIELLNELRSKQVLSRVASNFDAELIINKTIKGVTEDIENFGYNTAIAKLMGMLNELENVIARNKVDDLPAGRQEQSRGDRHAIARDDVVILIKLLAPFAPYLSEELWSRVRGDLDPVSVHVAQWPEYDEEKIVEDEVTIPIAINGKVRSTIEVESEKLKVESEILKMAKEDENVKKWIENKTIIKEIYVVGKMVNLVID